MPSVRRHPRASSPMFWRSRRVSLVLRPTSKFSATVSDIAETLEGKIRDMWDHIQAELRSERTHQQHVSDVARERRIADHETIEDRFERMTTAINERMIEFDQRIFRMNEDRAGSISLELQETIRMKKRYPDALMRININVSNAERVSERLSKMPLTN